jgi:hypothetical protein
VELIAMEGSTARLGWLYTVGRFACFLAVAALLRLIGIRNVWVLMLAALLLSAPLSFVLMRRVRLAWASRIDQTFTRRKAQKDKLRAALRGDDEPAAPSEPVAPSEPKAAE